MSAHDNESLPGFIKNLAVITSALRIDSRRALATGIAHVQSWMHWVASAQPRVTPAHFAHLYGAAAVDVARALVRRTYSGVCGRRHAGSNGVACAAERRAALRRRAPPPRRRPRALSQSPTLSCPSCFACCTSCACPPPR